MSATLLIGGTLLQWDPLHVTRGDLVMLNAQIAGMDADLPTTSTIDCNGCLVMPGLVLGHTHAYSALATGMPGPPKAPGTFREILEKVWWRLDRALDDESIQISAEVTAIQAIRSGTTTVVDHHESPSSIDGSLDRIAESLSRVGIRGVLTYGATDRHGEEGARLGIRENERFIEKHKDDPLLRGMVGLHAPFTCSDATIEASIDLARRLGVGLHTHAAEGPDDQIESQRRWNKRLMVHLDEMGCLTERTLLAHLVDISPDEAQLVLDRGAWVAHQARSNMNNGVGYAAGLASNPRMLIGTDGIDQDVLAELQVAFFRRREASGPKAWPDATDWVSRGHRFLGSILGAPFGSLGPGAPADVVVVEYDAPTPVDGRNLASHLIFGRSRMTVRDVFVAGRPILRNRNLVGIDEAGVMARARAHAARLWSRLS